MVRRFYILGYCTLLALATLPWFYAGSPLAAAIGAGVLLITVALNVHWLTGRTLLIALGVLSTVALVIDLSAADGLMHALGVEGFELRGWRYALPIIAVLSLIDAVGLSLLLGRDWRVSWLDDSSDA